MGRPRVRRNSTVITEPLPKYPSEDDIFPGQVGPNDTRNPDAPILPDRAMSATPTSSFETADGQRSRHTTSPPESPPPPPIEPDELPPAYEEVEGARNVPVLVENAPEARQEAGVVVEDATQRSS
ncbi:hypothetical protein HK102_003540 [Quaeritorhiza haematococci]|nr:hypothetical protein HK102_003540 [Quaeritorhiza haematococci]